MHQPEPLLTDEHVPWSWGVGNDIWSLFEASMQGDESRVLRLLRQSPSLVHASYGYRNALHFAVRENQPHIVKLLLENGSAITYTGERWHTSAPVQAADRGYKQVAEILRQHQLSRFGICEAGDQIADSIKARSLDAFRELLTQHGPDVADPRGNTPLHWGALTRQTAVIDLCLEAGGDINAARPDGARAIDLTHGDYWYRAWNNEVSETIRNAWPIVGYLLAKGAEYDLGTACRIGDQERIEAILKADPDAANKDADYVTWYSGFPLRNACKAGHLEIARRLLDSGADPNKPEHGLAPWGASLFDATQNGHEKVVRLLLDCGANPNQSVESSGTPLSICDNEKIRERLLAAGATYDWFGSVY
ncbi:MAG: ankyrin repeat domain-containing protein, partial [Planctomycetota bacterium]